MAKQPTHEQKKAAHDQSVKRNYDLQRKSGASHEQAARSARDQAARTCERLDRRGWVHQK